MIIPQGSGWAGRSGKVRTALQKATEGAAAASLAHVLPVWAEAASCQIQSTANSFPSRTEAQGTKKPQLLHLVLASAEVAHQPGRPLWSGEQDSDFCWSLGPGPFFSSTVLYSCSTVLLTAARVGQRLSVSGGWRWGLCLGGAGSSRRVGWWRPGRSFRREERRSSKPDPAVPGAASSPAAWPPSSAIWIIHTLEYVHPQKRSSRKPTRKSTFSDLHSSLSPIMDPMPWLGARGLLPPLDSEGPRWCMKLLWRPLDQSGGWVPG